VTNGINHSDTEMFLLDSFQQNDHLVEDTLLEAIKTGKTKKGMAIKLTRALESRKHNHPNAR
jgi:hypothetical protein